MYIKFNKLVFRNIGSYGNKNTIFLLNKGLNCISGINGQGKSTILDALCFCLYGKPFKKIKLNELINRENKKKLFTEVTLEIKNDIYVITRELKPDNLCITKNNKPLTLLSSKSLTQDEINLLLGIDITLFRQVISLAINYNKPFLALTTGEKRDIIETIFNIKVFGGMLKMIKNNNTDVKISYEINKKTINLLKDNVITLDKQLIEYTKNKDTFNEDKLEQLKSINEKINNVDNLICTLETSLNNLKKSIKENKTKLQDNIKRIGVINHMLGQIDNDLDFFKENSNCPKCKSVISEDHKHKTIEQYEIEKKNYKTEYEILEKTIKVQNSIQDKIQKLKYAKESLTEHTETKKYITEQKFSIDLEKLEEDLTEKKEEYTKVWKKLEETGNDIKLNEIVIKMLGDEGIKTYFFAKLIPILNQKINEYLDLFDLPVTIVFDEYMTETIDTLKDKNVSYMSFSEGEKKRIDIAILLSFIETTKKISNWGCNLIIFDELLDNSTDSDGLDKIFEAIKEMLYHDTNLCIYIISHRDLSIDFDGKYTIQKTGGFSSLNFEQQV